LPIISLFLSACNNNPEVNSDLLSPSVKKTQEFLEQIRQNDHDAALSLVYFYDTRSLGPYNRKFDALYKEEYSYVINRKLMPISKWRVYHDVKRAAFPIGYKIEFEDIIIPFAAEAKNEDSPAYLFVGYESGLTDKIYEFGFLRKFECSSDETDYLIDHMMRRGQLDTLSFGAK